MKVYLILSQWSELAQSCPTLCDPMDCSLPGSSLQGILPPWDFPGKSTGVGCHFLLPGIFLTQGLNPDLLHSRQTLNLWATREAQLSQRSFKLFQFFLSFFLPFALWGSPLLCPAVHWFVPSYHLFCWWFLLACFNFSCCILQLYFLLYFLTLCGASHCVHPFFLSMLRLFIFITVNPLWSRLLISSSSGVLSYSFLVTYFPFASFCLALFLFFCVRQVSYISQSWRSGLMQWLSCWSQQHTPSGHQNYRL